MVRVRVRVRGGLLRTEADYRREGPSHDEQVRQEAHPVANLRSRVSYQWLFSSSVCRRGSKFERGASVDRELSGEEGWAGVSWTASS